MVAPTDALQVVEGGTVVQHNEGEFASTLLVTPVIRNAPARAWCGSSQPR